MDFYSPNGFMRICSTMISISLFGILYSSTGLAQPFENSVPMIYKGKSTYYVECFVKGYGEIDMLVDTGSAYTTINEKALQVLIKQKQVTYVKDLHVKMADGSERVVPIYLLASILVGNACRIENVEAAVLPGNTRSMLGLSALNKTSPIMFSTNPPRLSLSNCATE